MNVIDALFITLGLDTRDFEKKQKEVGASLTKLGTASDKQTKLIAESGKKAAHSFSLLKVEVLGALAAFGMGAGFKDFIQSNINGQASLGRFSKTLGMSTHELQAWKLAAKEMGGSGDEAVGALQNVAKGMAEAKITGTSALIQASRRFGFDVSNNPAQTLMNISRRMSQAHDPQQALQIAQAAGISDFTMQQMLLQSPAKFQAQLAHAMSLTGAATKASTEQAARLQQQWADLQERFRQVGERVFNRLEPILAELGNKLATWIDGIDWNKVINAIGAFIDKVQEIVKEMGGWKTVAEILGGVLALKILAPVLMLASTFARLIPMFVGATTGVSGLALAFGSLGAALAGVAGYWAGSEIWTHVLAGTKAGDAVGEVAAKVMASLGNKNAQDAVNRANGRGPANHSGDFNASRTDWYKKKQADAIAYFQSQGFSRNAAIGMTANIARESSFDPHITGDNGKAYGLGQWHPDRQANFAKFTGMPIQGSSYQQQLAFYAHEVKQNKRLMGMLSQQDITAPASAMAVSYLNERPANGTLEAERRARMAQGMVSPYVGAGPAASAGKAGAGAATNEVHINTINVQTKATDANGVAKGMQKAMRNNPLIAGYVTAAA
jgi:hypothetical protein